MLRAGAGSSVCSWSGPGSRRASTPRCAPRTTWASSACSSSTPAHPATPDLVANSVSMIEMSGGIFGAVGTSARVVEAYAQRRRTSMSAPTTIETGILFGPVDRRAVHLAVRRRRSAPSAPRSSTSTGRSTSAASAGTSTAMGYDLNLTRAGLGPTQTVLAAARASRPLHRPHARGPPPRPLRLPAEQAVALEADRRRHRRRRARADGS